ncbi:MAG: response regulator [Desulfomonile tiedjei]|uniref:histidine kinase n=1 Tax=Desulfomonile tiedjei TaxID=2358 RepID=A0A9D6V674_9BACT|nr:response regulator [Desulfomonile tiedjei]
MEDPGKILIVEDSAMQAKRLRRLLEEHGYKVVVAFNGKEGLAAVRENNLSLIVSDIIMPEMDGYQMCRSIKQDPRVCHIPIILLTSLSNPDDVFLGLESGADSYISKPYEAKVLLSRIESVLTAFEKRKEDRPGEELEVYIGPKRYLIKSSRYQILNLLLSTYQDAVEQNRILREMRTKLVMVNEELQKLVAERTDALKQEIEERKRTEEALASEKERLSVTLRTILDGVITTNTEGEIILMNRAAEEFTGWPQVEAMGRPITSVCNLIKTETRESGETVVANILKSGGLFGVGDEITLVSRGGTERIVAVSGTPILDQINRIIGVILVFRDITESKRIEEELVKAQKLESLGVLAGGIAHDFNNLLTAILGNVSLAKMYSTPGDRAVQRLDEAEKASLRAKDLTQQLLTFAKGGAPVKKTVSISDVLKDSAKFALRGSNIRCRFKIADDLCSLEVDEGQIGQVVHNLIINAYQAMPDGGTIEVRAENSTIWPEQDMNTTLSSGRYVKISVADEGHGIQPEILPKIFDPYFSTKKRGSGLGLATSYSILKNHDGMITVESEVGLGSTFHIFLPVSTKREPKNEQVKVRPIQGNGKILVMDDEEMLRNFVGELLDLLGYEVKFAADGQETLEVYRTAKRDGSPFDCVLMDLTIPGGMGGREAIQRLLEIDPCVKAVVSSGYSDDPVMADFRKYGFCGVVAKPYDAEKLSEVLHRVINR